MNVSREKIQKMLIGLGEFYDKALTKSQLAMYADDLENLSAEQLHRAVTLWRNNPTNTRFPLPAQLIALVKPQMPTAKDLARDVAVRLLAAVDKFDYNWDQAYIAGGQKFFNGSDGKRHATWPDAMKAEVGTLGEAVINRFGGWKRFFDHVTEMDRGQATAQIRDYAESLQTRVKAHGGDLPPALPSSPSAQSVQGLLATVARKTAAPGDDP